MIGFPGRLKEGDSVAIDLAKGGLERKASERYNEAVKSNALLCKEGLRTFPRRHIECINTPDGCVLRSSREIRGAFRVNFRDRFARCPELQVHEFRNYLADFPRLGEAEAASCEVVVTECEVRSALKLVGLNRSPGLDGLPNEVYLRMSHMFVPILTNVFNHWFA